MEILNTAIAQLTELQSQPIKLSELGKIIAEFIKSQPHIRVNPWTKNGEMRIYIDGTNLISQGFVVITDKINFDNLNRPLKYQDFLSQLHFPKVENDLVPQPHTESQTSKLFQELKQELAQYLNSEEFATDFALSNRTIDFSYWEYD